MVNAALLIVAIVVVVLFVVAVFQLLWNTTMPQVFNLRPIAYWAAFRLLLIGGMLTGGYGMHFTMGR